MFNEPLLTNTREKIIECYNDSVNFFKENLKLYSITAIYLWSYHEIRNIVPFTSKTFWSGHLFPLNEAYSHLENSYLLCLEGFYTYSFVGLRRALELTLAYLYYSRNNKAHLEIQPWLKSDEDTPRFSKMIRSLDSIKYYGQFNKQFELSNKIKSLYGELCNYTHIKGLLYSSVASKSNVNQMSKTIITKYLHLLFNTINKLNLLMLIKHPIGLYPLPIDEKFGLNIPMGNFLQDHQTRYIFKTIDHRELLFLQNITEHDEKINATKKWINDMPDLSEEEWEKELEQFDLDSEKSIIRLTFIEEKE